MTGSIVSRQTAQSVLAGAMVVGFAVALIGGAVAIIRFGHAEAEAATLIAESFAWIFAAAFLASFGMAISESIAASRMGH
jgi:hypothetical protein